MTLIGGSKKESEMPLDRLDAFRNWAKVKFAESRPCIAYLESTDDDGDIGVGTCFHVGEGVFVTARHVLQGRHDVRVGFDDDSAVHAMGRAAEKRASVILEDLLIVDGPHFHVDSRVDVACFRLNLCRILSCNSEGILKVTLVSTNWHFIVLW